MLMLILSCTTPPMAMLPMPTTWLAAETTREPLSPAPEDKQLISKPNQTKHVDNLVCKPKYKEKFE